MAGTPLHRPPLDSCRLIRDINTVGWHAAIVEPDHGHRGWAWSIGFTQTFGHPEVAVFGLPADVLHTLIDTLGGSPFTCR